MYERGSTSDGKTNINVICSSGDRAHIYDYAQRITDPRRIGTVNLIADMLRHTLYISHGESADDSDEMPPLVADEHEPRMVQYVSVSISSVQDDVKNTECAVCKNHMNQCVDDESKEYTGNLSGHTNADGNPVHLMHEACYTAIASQPSANMRRCPECRGTYAPLA